MITRCTECNSKGTLSDELIGKEVRCPQCRAKFVATAIQNKKWYYADGDNKMGPFNQDQFDSLIAEATITPETLVWCNGMDEWQTWTQIQPPRQKKWYYADGDSKVGPFNQDQFDSLIAEATITPETLVWCNGMDEWQTWTQIQPPRQKKWYYADGDNKVGPIKQDQFDGLIASNTISANTLVWCTGMDGWKTWAETQSTVTTIDCERCHTTFASELLQNHDGAMVCESCVSLTSPDTTTTILKATTEQNLQYGNLVGRSVAKIIDLTFMLALAGLIEGLTRKLFPEAYTASDTISIVVMATLLTNMLIGVFYITWFVGKLGATPGKIIAKLKITNSYGNKISYAHAFGRYCGEYIAGLGVMSLLTFFIFWAIKHFFPLTPFFTSISVTIFLTFAIIYAPALFDPKRRTLYDHLCNTRVLAA